LTQMFSVDISDLTARVLAGGEITRDEALGLFGLEATADAFDLLAGANRIREHFKGNKIHLCSIVNAKAGACSENCSFCAQSSFYQTDSPGTASSTRSRCSTRRRKPDATA